MIHKNQPRRKHPKTQPTHRKGGEEPFGEAGGGTNCVSGHWKVKGMGEEKEEAKPTGGSACGQRNNQLIEEAHSEGR